METLFFPRPFHGHVEPFQLPPPPSSVAFPHLCRQDQRHSAGLTILKNQQQKPSNMPISPGLMPSHVPNLPPMFYGSLYDAYLWGISRHPGTFIVLSDFDPLPGDPTDAFRKMNLNANVFRPKRLVSMWAPNGRVVSRFVSDAPREVGVQDEGFWPRKVNLCGYAAARIQSRCRR